MGWPQLVWSPFRPANLRNFRHSTHLFSRSAACFRPFAASRPKSYFGLPACLGSAFFRS
jgi:hypothetical protein